MMDVGDVEFIGQWHHLAIHHAAADHKGFLAFYFERRSRGLSTFYFLHHFINAVYCLCSLEGLTGYICQHDIPSIGQRVFGQREEGTLTHHHGFPAGDVFEMLQVRRHVT